MIVDEIVLHNFGTYRDRQAVQLAPSCVEKPVVLFGGLNGAGKTTLLDALQLALYGKLARCSNRGTLGYDEFLRRCIHRDSDPREGAALEVQFRHTSAGVEHTYRVHRSWVPSGNGMRERTEVLRDGTFDRVLGETWQENVDEFLPARLAHLFFFDGEQIEALADIENAAQLLSTAIHSLLGLDLVDRLTTDLRALERRKRTATKSDLERAQIAALQTEIEQLEARRSQLVQERGATQNILDRGKKRWDEIEGRYRQEGGALFERREALETERELTTTKLHEVEDQLREEAAGPAPLLLLQDLLSAVYEQDRREEMVEQAETLSRILDERDKQLLAEAQTHKAPEALLSSLTKFLSKDRKKHAQTAQGRRYLSLHPETRENSRALRGGVLSDVRGRVNRLLEEEEALQSTLVAVERKLAGIPSQDALSDLIKKRHTILLVLEEAKSKLAVFDAEINRINRERERKQLSLTAQIERTVKAEFEQEAGTRIVSHAQHVRQTLRQFRTGVVERHVHRIERLVLGSLQQVLHKESLVSNLKIHPEYFSLELKGKNGQIISPDRLSAGERQLLAVALLWGLGRASGRPLPAIIDAPLGRLDAEHRSRLVERYFPHASHQVVLLSTDEEIGERYYEKLRPWISRSYRLVFDDKQQTTSVQPGYFWE